MQCECILPAPLSPPPSPTAHRAGVRRFAPEASRARAARSGACHRRPSSARPTAPPPCLRGQRPPRAAAPLPVGRAAARLVVGRRCDKTLQLTLWAGTLQTRQVECWTCTGRVPRATRKDCVAYFWRTSVQLTAACSSTTGLLTTYYLLLTTYRRVLEHHRADAGPMPLAAHLAIA